jgi:hypothetical protein
MGAQTGGRLDHNGRLVSSVRTAGSPCASRAPWPRCAVASDAGTYRAWNSCRRVRPALMSRNDAATCARSGDHMHHIVGGLHRPLPRHVGYKNTLPRLFGVTESNTITLRRHPSGPDAGGVRTMFRRSWPVDRTPEIHCGLKGSSQHPRRMAEAMTRSGRSGDEVEAILRGLEGGELGLDRAGRVVSGRRPTHGSCS